jgi:hypothetical protein
MFGLPVFAEEADGLLVEREHPHAGRGLGRADIGVAAAALSPPSM